MGLQVEIIKITEPDPIKIENGKYLRLVDDNGNYDDSQFEKWALKHKTQTVETWLDLEKFKLKTGIDIQNDYDIDYISYDTFGHETDSNEEWADYITMLKSRIQDGLYEQVALDKYMWLKEKYNNAITDNIIRNYREKNDIILSRI